MGSEIQIVLASCDEFLKKFAFASQLFLFNLRNPGYASQLIEMVLNYPEINQKLVNSWNDLVCLAEISPTHGKTLLQKNLEPENRQVFNRKTPISYGCTIFNRAVGVFPEYMQNLLQSALKNTELFQQVVPYSTAFFDIEEKFPELNYPEFILTKKEEFKRLIRYPLDLKKFIRKFPNHEDEALQLYCSNKEVLEDLRRVDIKLANRALKLINASSISEEVKKEFTENYELNTTISDLMHKLEYRTQPLGQCAGFALTAIRAFFLNKLMKCHDMVTYLTTTFDGENETIHKIKTLLESQSHQVTEDSKEIVNLLETFDEIALHQTKEKNSQLFNTIAFDSMQFPIQEEIKKQLGLVSLSLSVQKNYDEYISYVNYIYEVIKLSEENIGIELNMSYLEGSKFIGHVIAICYNCKTNNWALIDINQMPIKEIQNISCEEIVRFIANACSKIQNGQQLTLFTSELYAMNQEENYLVSIERAIKNRINENEPPESTLGLAYFELEILKTLRATGLTATHLRNWKGPQYFSRAHGEALEYLIKNRNFSPEEAVAEICDLTRSQAERIAAGLLRNEVIGLQDFQLLAVEFFKKYGLTAEHFQQWHGDFSSAHYNALGYLLKKCHMPLKDSLAELCDLTEKQANTILTQEKPPDGTTIKKVNSLVNTSSFFSSFIPYDGPDASSSPSVIIG